MKELSNWESKWRRITRKKNIFFSCQTRKKECIIKGKTYNEQFNLSETLEFIETIEDEGNYIELNQERKKKKERNKNAMKY